MTYFDLSYEFLKLHGLFLWFCAMLYNLENIM